MVANSSSENGMSKALSLRVAVTALELAAVDAQPSVERSPAVDQTVVGIRVVTDTPPLEISESKFFVKRPIFGISAMNASRDCCAYTARKPDSEFAVTAIILFYFVCIVVYQILLSKARLILSLLTR